MIYIKLRVGKAQIHKLFLLILFYKMQTFYNILKLFIQPWLEISLRKIFLNILKWKDMFKNFKPNLLSIQTAKYKWTSVSSVFPQSINFHFF